ncbi:MAG TPA: hypothetical protein VFJ91_00945 [Gaiellaceae bacterium]|nr:hypothetical protein [Gaiellaceae bacterium]
MRAAALAAAAVALATACGSAAATHTRTAAGRTVYRAEAGHRVAGFSLDRDRVALAEDAAGRGCPLVVVARIPASPQRVTAAAGETCRFGGRFWVRPGARAVGNAIGKALWVLRRGDAAEAVKGGIGERESPLVRVTGITDRGPFLGPVVAQNWLRLFGDYSRFPDGTLVGGAISANNRELWAATGPVLPLGLDRAEHAVAVGADGSIATWHAHGAHYGEVADAHARAAAVDEDTVYVLRSDAPRLDVRTLDGTLVRSWPVAAGAAPLLDVSGNEAVYLAGGAVHALRVDTGADSLLARASRGATLLDAQVSPAFVAWAERGGAAGAGRVVAVRR